MIARIEIALLPRQTYRLLETTCRLIQPARNKPAVEVGTFSINGHIIFQSTANIDTSFTLQSICKQVSSLWWLNECVGLYTEFMDALRQDKNVLKFLNEHPTQFTDVSVLPISHITESLGLSPISKDIPVAYSRFGPCQAFQKEWVS